MVFDRRIPFLGVRRTRLRCDSLATSGSCLSIRTWFLLRPAPSIVAVHHAFFRQQALSSVALLLLGLPGSLMAGNGYDLKPSQSLGKFQRVKVVLEVNGKLKLNAAGSSVSKLPIKVKGELLYDERMLAAVPGQRKHARYYHRAQATIEVQRTRKQTELPENRRLIVSQQRTQSLKLYSPMGPLSRDSLELVGIQGSSAVVDQLLPAHRVDIGESWSNDDATIGALLGLEAVLQNDVKSTMRKVEGPIVIVKMQGSVSGAVGGVSADIKLDAIYNFDRDLGQVTWLAMSIKEHRAIGHAEPGIDATARLRIALAPIDNSPALTDDALADLPLEFHEGSELVELHSQEGGFRFLHARGWQVMVDRHDVSILRLVQRGDLIAQCNASNLPPLKPDQQLQLAAFQADIQRALGDKFGQFTEGSRSSTEAGLRVLRTVVSGVVSELPIQWTYYHLSNKTGRQVSLVFTLDARLVERFADADQMLVESFRFVDLPDLTPDKQGPDTRSLRAAGQPDNSVAR